MLLVATRICSSTTGYRYDLLNRQTHVHLPDGRVQENLYDGEGLRAGLTENGKSTTFLFYNGEILAECNGDSMPIRRHLAGAGLSHVQNLGNDTFHAYHQDEQGSTAYVTGITGETENLYSYDGFGNLLESREGITNRILYTGQQYDQETGQYYLRARYYNPVIGRFTQEDTYRGDGLNLYAYCDNNPVMYYDPSGHQECGDKESQKATDPTPVDGVGEGGKTTEVFDIVEYGDKTPGLENHHGVMDVWAKNNVDGYKSRASDTPTIALTPEQHAATKTVYRDWLFERTGKKVGGKVDWESVSAREIQALSESMFDAANVPMSARTNYYSELTRYLYGLD